MSAERDKLLWRATVAMEVLAPEDLTLNELCRLVVLVERAVEREGLAGPVDNVITFASCRRRRARRISSRSQSAGAE